MMPAAVTSPSYTSSNHFKHTHPNPIFRATIARFNARLLALADKAAPATVLEVGCGEGFVLKFLAERRPSWRLAGCDVNTGAVTYAQSHCPASISFEVADIYHLPMPSRSFDLVICSEVLEHLDDAPAALAELQRISRGHVLITVPHEPFFRVLARLAVWLRLGPDPEHRQFWTAGAFRRLMRAHFREVTFANSSQYQLALGQGCISNS
jgi:ubiquinone/menaquinone biosynthesis C-methylase UbiE